MAKTSIRYAMAVDTRRCVGCSSCVLACKAENGLPVQSARRWVVTETRGTFPELAMLVRSEGCHHCASAPCVSNCPTGASHYGKGGAVLVDSDLCTGCKACLAACPYDARFIHPDGYADKCTFCLHNGRPACAASCPASAITFGDRNDPDSAISKLLRANQHRVLQPERGTDPNVFYLI